MANNQDTTANNELPVNDFGTDAELAPTLERVHIDNSQTTTSVKRDPADELQSSPMGLQQSNPNDLFDPNEALYNPDYDHAKNVLKKFRSYSYHHVLFVCENFDVFNSIADLPINNTSLGLESEVFSHSEDELTEEQKRAVKKYEDEELNPGYTKYNPKISPGGNGKYCVIINTAQDADILLDSVKLKHILVPSEKTTKKHGLAYQSTFVEGSMILSEPFGARLLDIIAYVARILDTPPYALVYGLKTFFVGYTDDEQGGVKTDIVSIKPFSFCLNDLQATFSASGSSYVASMLSMLNGYAAAPMFSLADSSIRLTFTQNSTLQDAFQDVIDKINTAIQLNYNTSMEIAAKEGNIPLVTPKKIQYAVDFVDPFENVPGAGGHFKNFRVDGTQRSIQHSLSKVHFSSGIGSTISTIFEGIMSTSTQVAEMMGLSISIDDKTGGIELKENKNRKDPTAKFYKARFLTYPEHNGDTILIHYLIVRERFAVAPIKSTEEQEDEEKFKEATRTNNEAVVQHITAKRRARDKQVQAELDEANRREMEEAYRNGNFLMYDYIFSGKNVDIINFDLRMTYGLAALFSFTSNRFPMGSENITKHTTSVSKIDSTRQPLSQGQQTIGMNPNSGSGTSSTAKLPGNRDAFYQHLSRHAQIEVSAAKLIIHGNPMLLNSLTRIPKDYEDFKQRSALESAKQEGVVEDQREPLSILSSSNVTNEAQVMANWEIQPALVKINVFMPAQEYARGTLEQQREAFSRPEKMFREQFWFDGLFRLVGIESNFADGSFKQTLELLALPYPEAFPAQTVTPSTGVEQPVITEEDEKTSPQTNQVITAEMQDANVKAWLALIRKVEVGGDNYSKIVNPGSTCNTLDKHPVITGQIYDSGHRTSKNNRLWYDKNVGEGPKKLLPSSASGAYQFIVGTWKNCASRLGLTDFSPESQDKAAIFLTRGREALEHVKAGRVITAMRFCRREWESFDKILQGNYGSWTKAKAVEYFKSQGGTPTEKA